MKQKSRKQNIDKCKIFDYFAKKAGFRRFQVFVRKYAGIMFGLNGVDGENLSWVMYDNSSMGSSISDFICKKKKMSKWHDLRQFTLESFPKKFKEAVVDHCIGTGISILMNRKLFMPAISCLEELMIKMELES